MNIPNELEIHEIKKLILSVMMPKYKIDITVVGLGYVGLPVAVKLSQSLKLQVTMI